MIRRDGARSLWRGHSTTILRIVPYAAFSYAFHDYAESYFKKKIKLEKLPFELKFLAGAIGGAAATLLTYPLDVLRVRMAIDRKTSWMKALKQGGFLQGLVPTMVGIIPYSGTAWCIKQSATESFSTFTCREPILLEALVINAFAG